MAKKTHHSPAWNHDREPDCMPDVIGAVLATQRGNLRLARLCNKHQTVSRSLDEATLNYNIITTKSDEQ